MEHEHIHTLQITKLGEKKLFQIRLPKNAKKITGILVTVQAINTNPFPTDTPAPLPIFPAPVKEPIPVATLSTAKAASDVIAATNADTTNTVNTNNNAKPIFPLEQVIP